MDVSDQNDRRNHSRVEFACDIKILLQQDGKQVILEGNSKDLSQRGLFVRTRKRFPPGTGCEVKIFLTGGIDPIELLIQGTLVRQTDSGMGVEFNSMDLDTYGHIKNIVLYNSSNSA